MSTQIDSAAYLDELTTLAQRGFSSIQSAMDAVLPLVTEQLLTRSSFLTQVIPGTEKEQVLAAFNLPGGYNIRVGTTPPLSKLFQSMMLKMGKPTPLLLENLPGELALSSAVSSVFNDTGCYIGIPVVLSDGTHFGVLCTIDPEPRELSPIQIRLLVVLARLLASQVERDQEMAKHKQAEAELDQALTSIQIATERWEYVNKMQGDFISIVNHEFRTTLTGIQGFSELMRDEEFSFQEIKEYAADINADARRLSHMINQLLDLDQMKSGRVALHLEKVDLNDVIMGVANRVRPTMSRHRLHLQLDAALSLLAGDRDKLTQVITNLVNNALKYSPDGGEIILSTRIESECVHVSVQDQGMGIPPHALEQVFDPYYSRTESEALRYVKGAGLGLSIVRQIIHMHDGRTWAESTPGSGSVFHFTIPLVGLPTTMEENNG
jgi:signal transduction histidine kinase